MADAYVLSDKDLDLLKGLIKTLRDGVKNPRLRGIEDLQDYPATSGDLYIARTPADGISAMGNYWAAGTGSGTSGTGSGSGTIYATPGVAECSIYQPDQDKDYNDVLKPIPQLTDFVYNIGQSSVPGNTYIIVSRDNFGTFYCISTAPSISSDGDGIGDGDGNCCGDGAYCYNDLAKLQTTDCLLATSSYDGGSVMLEYDGSRWVSTDEINYPGGSGLVEFWYVPGEPLHLGVYYTAPSEAAVLLELVACGDGCWRGGPLTGHVADSGTACAGETFTVCLECVSCPRVTAACCPDDPLPYTLYGTIINRAGSCSCLPTDSFPMAYDSGSDSWSNLSIAAAGCSPQTHVDFTLKCEGVVTSEWHLSSTVCLGSTTAATDAVCRPFLLTFTGLTCGGACSGGTYDLIISE